jgi:hypothetical protein
VFRCFLLSIIDLVVVSEVIQVNHLWNDCSLAQPSTRLPSPLLSSPHSPHIPCHPSRSLTLTLTLTLLPLTILHTSQPRSHLPAINPPIPTSIRPAAALARRGISNAACSACMLPASVPCIRHDHPGLSPHPMALQHSRPPPSHLYPRRSVTKRSIQPPPVQTPAHGTTPPQL